MGRCWESLQEEHERHTSETPTTPYFGDQGEFLFLIKVNIQKFTGKDLQSVPSMPGFPSSRSSRKTSAKRPFVFPEEWMWAEVFGNIFTRQLRCPWSPCTASSRSNWGPILGSQFTQHQVDFFFRHLFSELMWSQAWNLKRWSPWRQMQFKKWLTSINNCQEVSNEWVLTSLQKKPSWEAIWLCFLWHISQTANGSSLLNFLPGCVRPSERGGSDGWRISTGQWT